MLIVSQHLLINGWHTIREGMGVFWGGVGHRVWGGGKDGQLSVYFYLITKQGLLSN